MATPVLTLLGPVPIESLCTGDQVVSFDDQTGEVQINRVLDTVQVASAAIIDLTLQYPHGGTEQLGTTDDHPFYVTLRANGDGVQGWVQASQLQGGDEVRTLTGTALVYAVSFTSRWETVYNLQVEGTSTYYVGTGGVGVHNCGEWAPRNKHLAGSTHPVTKVPFDSDGYPDFSKWVKLQFKKQGGFTFKGGKLDRNADRDDADRVYRRIFGRSLRDDNKAVHHHQDGETIQIIDSWVHARTGHTGP